MAEELINENEELVGVNVIDEVQEELQEETQEEQNLSNPFIDYIQKAFVKERFEEYINTLNEEQKKFILTFILGFQAAIGHNIVGVYDYDYINGFHFTKELLDSLGIVLRPIEVTDLEMKFVVVAQY